MAINGIQGKPGGGKSYEAVVNHIIPTITRDRRKVVTNLPLNVEHFVSVFGDYCRDLIEVVDGQFHNYGGERPFSKKDHYLQYENWQNEQGQRVYFVVDEAHLAMGAGSCDKELKEFFSMHRHYGFDILLLTQNFRKIDRDVRDMIQIGYRAIKKSMIGQDDKYILKVHDGASSSTSSVVNTFEREYEKRYFPFYQSHTKSNQSINEATTKDVKKWYKHPAIILSPFFIFFGLGFLINSVSAFNPDKKIEHYEKSASTSPIEKSASTSPIEKSASTSPVEQSSAKTALKKVYKNNDDNDLISKSLNELILEREVKQSKNYHPFYKVKLSVSGFADYLDVNHRVKKLWITASQNGQAVFTISTQDLMLAGYKVFVLSECLVKVVFYEYSDYLTCDAPTQTVKFNNEEITRD
jgi:zona occludens toxin